ncbi:hypothetical protein RASY3_14660 [Ruminococcus albus SY3]|uniref:Uncharacterized protein n=1 Tax=Ruminococcus albus SY3 TaxID=1341156 RepID=A0A011UZE9_RUMAL|nr:hypothetical protein [Ruminococcus albus]EXM38552.1 hypothetical protein RASY3_14660 [Ruminococcus albus SY3]
MFLLQWINDYISTSKMDMTAEIEALYYVALLIISSIVIIGIAFSIFIITKLKKFINKIQKRIANEDNDGQD